MLTKSSIKVTDFGHFISPKDEIYSKALTFERILPPLRLIEETQGLSSFHRGSTLAAASLGRSGSELGRSTQLDQVLRSQLS